MNQPLRFSSAASLVVLGSVIAGCAAHQARVGSATHVNDKVPENASYATRALAALSSNNAPMAIELAEQAVAKSPMDASVRLLLGNSYFAGGRFRSAETAYRETLTIDPSQSQVVLKLALVEIAQGKNREAVAFLNQARGVLDPSDYGLALALAGRPAEAIMVLNAAARQDGADATVRQNLALAHALAGDWDEARTIAAQDVPANQLDGRIHQWMQLAAPKSPADQIAALIGVTPAAVDSGLPVQLALNKDETREAQASAPAATVARIATAAPVAPAKPVFVAAAAQAAPPAVVPVPPAPPPARPTIAIMASNAMMEAKTVLSSILPHYSVSVEKPARPHVVAAAKRPSAGKSPTVVQLGAYGSPGRVLAAWNGAAHKYGALKAYLPMSARFASQKGTFYRLSVRGFDSVSEANALCGSIKHSGGSCFVRNFAGDVPVRYASR